jgi:hypothetical protein
LDDISVIAGNSDISSSQIIDIYRYYRLTSISVDRAMYR